MTVLLLLGRQRAVVAGGRHAVADQRVDLVLHQRDERRHDQGHAVADQRRGLEADRLARPGGHHDQRIAARPASPPSPRAGAAGSWCSPSSAPGRPAGSRGCRTGWRAGSIEGQAHARGPSHRDIPAGPRRAYNPPPSPCHSPPDASRGGLAAPRARRVSVCSPFAAPLRRAGRRVARPRDHAGARRRAGRGLLRPRAEPGVPRDTCTSSRSATGWSADGVGRTVESELRLVVGCPCRGRRHRGGRPGGR